MPKYEDLDASKIVDMFESGLSINKISNHFGVSHGRISNLLKKYGYTATVRQKLPELEVCRAYQDGITATKLGEQYKCSASLIYQILNKHGIKRQRRVHVDVDEKKVVAMYNNGITAQATGEHFDIDQKRLTRILEENNIHIRSTGETQQKHFYNYRFFQTIDTEAKAYWLGFIFADGNVSTRMKDVSIALAAKDRKHIEKFIKDLDYSGPGPIMDGEGETTFGFREWSKVSIRSEVMCWDLVDKNCYPNKTHDILAPAKVPKDLVRHFIRGVVDGDGGIYIYPTSSSLEIVGGYDLLDWIRVQKEPNLSNLQKHKGIWRVRTHVSTATGWIEWLYGDCTISLDRKQSRADEVLKRRKND